ncbi:tetratricopeptide repeat protein [Polynucleobacter sp. MG-27-Goln-C1]|uniref:tetratricopeptide repeat protein n=1 Tax=Polynucleobacter sp. MG-27-Goln-C1 TaxID=1819726 RepID=UPI001C0DD354|nr:tetratricopeptide repeat protein [Polynucleobacter sp. MG-27-Goln-C1]MBU3612657.1 tetratricopeptide repeat protein [Polynucleobacter sp. MG-27-Goln-C1]
MPNKNDFQSKPSSQLISTANTFLENGFRLHQSGELSQAETQYLAALKINPEFFEPLHFLGILKIQKNDFQSAIKLFTQAIEINQSNEYVYLNRGLALYKAGSFSDALKDFQTSSQLSPRYPEAYFNLANTYQELTDYKNAVINYDKAISFSPQYAEAFNNRGNALQELGMHDDALRSYKKALEIAPDYAEAYFNCGTLFQSLKDFKLAIKYFDQAISLQPDFVEAHINNGDNYDELNDSINSSRCYGAALKIDPSSLEARYALALSRIPKIYSTIEELAASRELFSTMLSELEDWINVTTIKNGYKVVGGHQLFFLAYQNEDNSKLLSRYGNICHKLMKDLQPILTPSTAVAARAKMKIGFVSGYIHQHSVWNAILKGWVTKLDPTLFEVHIFHLGEKFDGETEIAKTSATSFTQGKYSIEKWISCIQEKQLDAIIYPEIGMDRLTCQLASVRIAPVQICSWGHPETSGLPTLDYYLSAEQFEDKDSQKYYREKLISLPNLGCYYEPYVGAINLPDLASLGINVNRPILLCPGTPYKYNPSNDWILVDIVKKIPHCQLIFFNFPDTPIDLLKKRLSDLFHESNLDFNHHVIFIPLLTTANFYGLMNQADVFLDTIGFSGFNTSIQAIECALPVVTKKGKFMRGRLASGILEQLGMLDLVAKTDDDYINQAVKLTQDKQYRTLITEQIKGNRQKLYCDLAPIKALEEFLICSCNQSIALSR